MINVVCVHVGNYCGRGTEYICELYDAVTDHLRQGHRFWCITDNPEMVPVNRDITPILADEGVNGWWSKIALFRPGVLPKGERVLYSDLDARIVGDLTDVAAYRGKFAAIRDFYFKGNLNSGLMAWEAGTLDHIWRIWDRCGRPEFEPMGDQAWIERLQPEADRWQDILPEQVVSFKVDCRSQGGAPSNARIVAFHGNPRPHEVPSNLYAPSQKGTTQ